MRESEPKLEENEHGTGGRSDVTGAQRPLETVCRKAGLPMRIAFRRAFRLICDRFWLEQIVSFQKYVCFIGGLNENPSFARQSF